MVLDSTSAHTFVRFLVALCLASLRYAVIPGGPPIFARSTDTALAALHRTAHRLYNAQVEGTPKLTAAQARNLFAELCLPCGGRIGRRARAAPAPCEY